MFVVWKSVVHSGSHYCLSHSCYLQKESLPVMSQLNERSKHKFKLNFNIPTEYKYTESMCCLLRTLRNIQSHFYEQ